MTVVSVTIVTVVSIVTVVLVTVVTVILVSIVTVVLVTIVTVVLVSMVTVVFFDYFLSTASSSSERSLERSHRRIAGKKSLEPLAAYSQSQRTDHPQRQHRSPTDPRYFPPPPMMMYPQPYPGMYPYAYPPMVPGYLPYYLPHPEEVPVVLNVIKEEGSTQDSEVSLPTLPPPASAQKRPPSSDPPAGLDEFVLY